MLTSYILVSLHTFLSQVPENVQQAEQEKVKNGVLDITNHSYCVSFHVI